MNIDLELKILRDVATKDTYIATSYERGIWMHFARYVQEYGSTGLKELAAGVLKTFDVKFIRNHDFNKKENK